MNVPTIFNEYVVSSRSFNFRFDGGAEHKHYEEIPYIRLGPYKLRISEFESHGLSTMRDLYDTYSVTLLDEVRVSPTLAQAIENIVVDGDDTPFIYYTDLLTGVMSAGADWEFKVEQVEIVRSVSTHKVTTGTVRTMTSAAQLNLRLPAKYIEGEGQLVLPLEG